MFEALFASLFALLLPIWLPAIEQTQTAIAGWWQQVLSTLGVG